MYKYLVSWGWGWCCPSHCSNHLRFLFSAHPLRVGAFQVFSHSTHSLPGPHPHLQPVPPPHLPDPYNNCPLGYLHVETSGALHSLTVHNWNHWPHLSEWLHCPPCREPRHHPWLLAPCPHRPKASNQSSISAAPMQLLLWLHFVPVITIRTLHSPGLLQQLHHWSAYYTSTTPLCLAPGSCLILPAELKAPGSQSWVSSAYHCLEQLT